MTAITSASAVAHVREIRVARSHRADGGSGALRRNIVAELHRTFGARGWLYQLAFALALSALGTAAVVGTIGKPHGIDVSTAEGVRTVFSGGWTAGLMASVLGAVSVTGEYRHATIGATLLAAGRPHRWLLAKLVVVGAFGMSFTVGGQAVVLAVGAHSLHDRGIAADLWSGDLLRLSLGTASLGLFCAWWGVACGLLVRRQVVTVTGLVVYATVVETALLSYFPHPARYLPGGLQAAIVVNPNAAYRLPVAAAYALFSGWILLVLAAGWLRLTRSDVPGH
jgi:ABC-2 type transport system permease protein